MLGNIIRLIGRNNNTDHSGHGNFNHCSSMCKLNNGILLAWYSGSSECSDDQSVNVVYINEYGETSNPLIISNNTGNPVLFHDETPVLLYSKFEDSESFRIRRLSDRWKTCSLWLQRIIVKNNKIIVIGDKKQLACPDQHLLGRCSPIQFNGNILLPLYDEVERKCVIFSGKDLKYSEIARYGDDIIQPTIWTNGNKLSSLSRNFINRSGKILNNYAFLHESSDGKSWSEPIVTKLPNFNSSVQVTKWKDINVVLWNDTIHPVRNNLTLGILSNDSTDVERIAIIDAVHGSYPAICIDNQDKLHLSFTNASRRIEHHVWTYRRFCRSRRG